MNITTCPGYDPAMNMGGSVSGILTGSASTVYPEPERNSHSTIAGVEYLAETTLQSIPSPSSPGASSGCSKPAFHSHKALQDVDGRWVKQNGQCKQTGTKASEREEKEEELGVLLISESDDSGSHSGSEVSDTGLGDHVSEGSSDYSPLLDAPAPGDDEPDYPSFGLLHLVFQQARTDYLLDFERRKYKAQKNARTRHYSVRYPRTRAQKFFAYIYRCGNGDRIIDGDGLQGMLVKDKDIFMRAWRKNQERISKEFGNLVGNEEEAAYDADDDSGSELQGGFNDN